MWRLGLCRRGLCELSRFCRTTRDHRRRRRGGWGHPPKKKSGKIFFRAIIILNWGILLIFHTYIFQQKCVAPQSWLSSYAYIVTELKPYSNKYDAIVLTLFVIIVWAQAFLKCCRRWIPFSAPNLRGRSVDRHTFHDCDGHTTDK